MFTANPFPALRASLAAALVAIALTTACGGPDDDTGTVVDRCDDVQCGDDASCVPETGECACDQGFLEIDGACTNALTAPCRDVAPVNATSEPAEVPIAWDGARWSDPADCAWSCDAGFGDWLGQCLDAVAVPCSDEPPEDARSLPGLVGITWDDADGWSEPADCEWACEPGFGEHEGACLSTREVPCLELPPPGATAIPALVEIAWDDAAGWAQPEVCAFACAEGTGPHAGTCLAARAEVCDDAPPEGATSVDPGALVIVRWTGADWEAPAACPWACDDGLGELDGACLASRELDCVDVAPARATSEIAPVEVGWDPEIGWAAPDCAWACDPGFGEFEGACSAARAVECANAAPANAMSLPGFVVVTWSDGAGWSAPAACEWACDDGFGEVDGACFSEIEVDCDRDPSTPANASPIVVDVVVGWIGDRFEDPALCDWSCDDGFGELDGACASERVVTCEVDPGAPAASEPILADVTVPWLGDAWGAPELCDWRCADGFGEVDGDCLDEIFVSCELDPSTPTNASAIVVDVPVRWTGDRFDDPSLCDWACDDGFGAFEGGCFDEIELPCVDVAPDGAETIGEVGAPVAVSWDRDRLAFDEPACPWACVDGFVEVDGACEPSVTVDACAILDPLAHAGWIFDRPTVYGTVDTRAPIADGGFVAGLDVSLCWGLAPLPADVTVADLTCVGAALDEELSDDATKAYFADLAIDDAGVYEYVYAFSTDGAETFAVCDAVGIVAGDLLPGEADVVAPRNGGFEVWADASAPPTGWTRGSALTLTREGGVVRSGTYATKVSRTLASGSGVTYQLSSARFPVTEGQVVTLEGWALDNDPNARINFGVQFYTGAGSASSLVAWPGAGGDLYTTDGTDWQLRARTVTVPATATQMLVGVRSYRVAGTADDIGTVWIDDLRVTVAGE